MINQGNNVPDNTIAIFMNDDVNYNDLDTLLSKPSKKRDWFTPHFYRCLPLTIGNQYGFVIKSQFDFYVEWNGGPNLEDTKFYFDETLDEVNNKYPNIKCHFGHGIVTITPPFTLRTPPGVNLMTINPPNYVLPNITVMTGVVESDNLRRNFTLNLKLQIPNIRVFIPSGTPLAGIIPIPRYYCDNFKLENAEDIFDNKTFIEELQAEEDALEKRNTIEYPSTNGVGRDYLTGKDVYGNNFPDHQIN